MHSLDTPDRYRHNTTHIYRQQSPYRRSPAPGFTDAGTQGLSQLKHAHLRPRLSQAWHLNSLVDSAPGGAASFRNNVCAESTACIGWRSCDNAFVFCAASCSLLPTFDPRRPCSDFST